MNARMTCVTMPRRDTERECVCVCRLVAREANKSENIRTTFNKLLH
jgi:hypothetical protein